MEFWNPFEAVGDAAKEVGPRILDPLGVGEAVVGTLRNGAEGLTNLVEGWSKLKGGDLSGAFEGIGPVARC